jgi:hypothetical protein
MLAIALNFVVMWLTAHILLAIEAKKKDQLAQKNHPSLFFFLVSYPLIGNSCVSYG